MCPTAHFISLVLHLENTFLLDSNQRTTKEGDLFKLL